MNWSANDEAISSNQYYAHEAGEEAKNALELAKYNAKQIQKIYEVLISITERLNELEKETN